MGMVTEAAERYGWDNIVMRELQRAVVVLFVTWLMERKIAVTNTATTATTSCSSRGLEVVKESK